MDICQQLILLAKSKKFIVILIIGVILALLNVNFQEKQVVCGLTDKEQDEFFNKRAVASYIIIIALIFFFAVSYQAAKANKWCNQSSNIAFMASGLNLLASLVRIYDLYRVRCLADNSDDAQENGTTEAEEETEIGIDI